MNKFLKFIKFSELTYWTAKRYFITNLKLTNKYPQVLFGKFLSKHSSRIINIEDEKVYKIIGVRSYGKGAYINREVQGQNLNMKKYQLVEPNLLLWCKVDTKNGAFGVVTENLVPSYASSNMALAKINNDLITNDYLQLLFTCPQLHKYLDLFVSGTTNRKYIKIDELLTKIKIPLPSLEKQKEIVDRYNAKIKLAEEQEKEAQNLEQEIDEKFCFMLGIKTNIHKINLEKQTKGLRLIHFKDTCRWDYFYFNEGFALIDKCLSEIKFDCVIFETIIKQLINGIDSRNYIKTGIPYLRVANIKPDRICLDDLKYIGEADKNKKGRVKKGELLITRKGTYGNAVVVNQEMEDKQCVISSEVFKISLKNDKYRINPYFLSYYINSRISKIQMERVKTRGIMGSLSQDALNSLKIAIPAIDVQNEIVDTIAKLKAKIKKLTKLAEQNRQLAEEEFEKELFE